MMNENCTLTIHKVDLVKYNADWVEQAAIAMAGSLVGFRALMKNVFK